MRVGLRGAGAEAALHSRVHALRGCYYATAVRGAHPGQGDASAVGAAHTGNGRSRSVPYNLRRKRAANDQLLPKVLSSGASQPQF